MPKDVFHYLEPRNFTHLLNLENRITVTASLLNVRKQPSTKDEIITQVGTGQEFEFVNTANPVNGYTWYEIDIKSTQRRRG